jgi:DNA repair exonuclease SbcCD ATPase subunit
MVGESDEGLPEELRRWVDEQADAAGEEPGDVLTRAVGLYRLVDDETGQVEGTPIGDLETDVERLDDSVSDLDSRVETVETDLETKITDVRERVIQVKREADAKAPADHDHEEIRTQLDGLETRVGRGFENYEEVLSYLTDETDELNDKLTRLAQVVVSVRRRTERVERDVSRLHAAANLKRAANRHGMTKGKCEECGNTVVLGLLTEPACPHCESGFVDIDPPGRLFRPGTLLTGRPPALEAGADPDTSEGDERERDGTRMADTNGRADAAAGLTGGSRNV